MANSFAGEFEKEQKQSAAGRIAAPSSELQLWGHDRLLQSCPSSVPFEEDDKDPRTWFLDHNFVESMTDMSKKVNGTLTLLLFAHTRSR